MRSFSAVPSWTWTCRTSLGGWWPFIFTGEVRNVPCQATCQYFCKNRTTGCRKTTKGGPSLDHLHAIQFLKTWCCSAPGHTRQKHRLVDEPDTAALPPSAVLDAQMSPGPRADQTIDDDDELSDCENTHTAQTTLVFLHLKFFHCNIVQVKALVFACCPSVVRSLLCVSRTDILESCWWSVIALRIATAALGKESRCVHTTFIHCAPQTLRGFCGCRRHTPFTGCEPKCRINDSQKLTYEKRPSHADSSGRNCLCQEAQ